MIVAFCSSAWLFIHVHFVVVTYLYIEIRADKLYAMLSVFIRISLGFFVIFPLL